jgi:hypothetical protein
METDGPGGEDPAPAPSPAKSKGKNAKAKAKAELAEAQKIIAELKDQITQLETQLAAATSSTDAERIATLESQLAASKAEVDDLTSIISKSNEENAQLRSAEQLMRVLPRPMQFDGTKQFTEFRAQMQMYLTSVKLPTNMQAPVAAAYLIGPALQWWMQHSVTNPMPSSWEEMLTLLNARFDHLNPEMAARNRLQSLRQGAMSVHAYLKEFEACYAHIPVVDETDKIFRFLYGLSNNLKDKFAVNPTTHRMWESFPALVAYITNFVADAPPPTGALSDILDKAPSAKAPVSSSPNHLKPKGGVTKPNSKNKGRQMSAEAGNKMAATMFNKANKPINRTKAIKSHCIKNGLCICCFKKTDPPHRADECTANPVGGAPPGFSSG